MKIGTMSQQNNPHKIKRPRFFNCEEVPRQIVSSAMAPVLSEWRRSTSPGPAAASLGEALRRRDNSPAFQRWDLHDRENKSRRGRKNGVLRRALLSSRD